MAQEPNQQPATDILNAQRDQWQQNFSSRPGMFGYVPSFPAGFAAELFRTERKNRILELGGGQGRDSLYFARSGFDLTVVDYSYAGLRETRENLRVAQVGLPIQTVCQDVRKPLPFDSGSFDAVYSHMLYCMALTTPEIVALSDEIRRVLKPGGLNIFTVRTRQDAHYRTGIHRGEDMYEVGGFIVHFFDRAKVEQVASGYELVSLDNFDEGGLPRRLFLVVLRKPAIGAQAF